MKKSSKKRAKKQTKKPAPGPEIVSSLKSAFVKLRKIGLTTSKKLTRTIKGTEKYIIDLVEKFSDVLQGRAKPVAVKGGKQRAAYREAGYRTIGPLVVVDVTPGEKIEVKDNLIYRKRKLENGTWESVIIPVAPKDLASYLQFIKNNPSAAGHLPEGGRWTFRMYGNQSYATFSDIDLLIERLAQYKSIDEAITKQDALLGEEIINNLEFVTLKRDEKWRESVFTKSNATGRNARKGRPHSEHRNAADRRSYGMTKRFDPEGYERILERKRAASRRRRAKKKGQ